MSDHLKNIQELIKKYKAKLEQLIDKGYLTMKQKYDEANT